MFQEQALEILKSGQNVFITGAAGTGKTYLLNQFIQYLKDIDITYAVTASTGIAATHLNGTTIHSWSGIGIKNTLSDKDLEKINKRVNANFKSTKVLIIDEISMLHAHQLNMVDKIAKYVLNNDKPFGGMQIVFCGDFCQLPPVSDNDSEVVFAFESKAWIESNLKVCYLHKSYRQNECDKLLYILNSIRENFITNNLREALADLYANKISKISTKLYTKNINVDIINNSELTKIKEKSYFYEMQEYGDPYIIENLKKRCLAKEKLELKVGALVIFIKNHRFGEYVNGTQGKITGFNKGNVPIVETHDGKQIYVTKDDWVVENSKGQALGGISQIPLCLAWAITVHKSQGMTLNSAEIDLGDAFCYGMGYVALSRVIKASGIKLLGFNEKSMQIDPKMRYQDEVFKKQSYMIEGQIGKLL